MEITKRKENMQNQIISELYTDYKKSKYSSKPNDIPKSAKNIYKKLHTKDPTSKKATAELFNKISNRKKISNKQFHRWEVTKSINSPTNIKCPANDSLTTNFINLSFNFYLLYPI